MPTKTPLSSFEKKAIEFFGRYYGGLNTKLFRATKGKLGGSMQGAPILLLTTTGRKSGQARTTPLLYLRDGERYVIVASKGGFPSHPAWYLNLSDQPRVEVELGAEKLPMLARTANEQEKAHYWPLLVAMYKGYANYQERTDRPIPVVILEPARAERPAS
ncbi:MAG: nitroreductase family deazaflavin-dependent oxidoreductase [Myxococcales bacterium]